MNKAVVMMVIAMAYSAIPCVADDAYTIGEQQDASAPAEKTRFDRMQKKDLRQELKRLHNDLLAAEKAARTAEEQAVAAREAYGSASDEQKTDTLIPMLEADVARRKRFVTYRQIQEDFNAAKSAYMNLLLETQDGSTTRAEK